MNQTLPRGKQGESDALQEVTNNVIDFDTAREKRLIVEPDLIRPFTPFRLRSDGMSPAARPPGRSAIVKLQERGSMTPVTAARGEVWRVGPDRRGYHRHDHRLCMGRSASRHTHDPKARATRSSLGDAGGDLRRSIHGTTEPTERNYQEFETCLILTIALTCVTSEGGLGQNAR